jgi:uncharacterized metal-binding protein YceD (DUF177 family)
METPLKIYVEQYRDGKREALDYALPSEFLEIKESDLTFRSPVYLKGEVYATDEHLILQLSAHTEAEMPCNVCNKKIFVPVKADMIYHAIPLEEIPSTIFDFSDLVREEIVLLTPQFVECSQGKCPERTDLSKIMKNKAVKGQNHFPFADL